MKKNKLKKQYKRLGIFIIIVIILVIIFTVTMKTPKAKVVQVREPIVSGSFYPASASELNSTIKGFLDKTEKKPLNGTLKLLILPHAGYVFSGPVAAYGIKELEGMKFSKVIVIGPTHHNLAGSRILSSLLTYTT